MTFADKLSVFQDTNSAVNTYFQNVQGLIWSWSWSTSRIFCDTR